MGGSSGGIISSVLSVAAVVAACVLPGTQFLLPATMQWTAMGGMYVSVGLMAAASVLGGGAKKDEQSFSAAAAAEGRDQNVRQAISYHRWVYGRCRIGGSLTWWHSNGSKNKNLHTLWTLTGCPIDGLEQLYVYDQAVTLDAGGWVQNGDYKNLIQFKFGNGTVEGDADLQATMEAVSGGGWTNAHRQYGCAKLYMLCKWDEKFSGIPQWKAVVRGRRVMDPRTSATAYSNNLALCIRDLLLNHPKLRFPAEDLHDDNWIAEANICDEDVAIPGGGSEKRYTVDGEFTLDQVPETTIKNMLTSCRGMLVPSASGIRLYTAAWREPTITLTLDDLDGPISGLVTRTTRSELGNGIRGLYTNPETWETTDYPAVSSAAYLAEDNGDPLWLNADQPFNLSPYRAQRVAKIELAENRQQIAFTLPLKISGLRCAVGLPVRLSIPKFGWVDKPFLVLNAAIALRDGGEDQPPRLGIDLKVKETAEASFDDPDLEAVDPAPDTGLPNWSTVDAPRNLALSSGTSELYLRGDGTVASRLKLAWDEVDDGYVLQGGSIEVQYKASASEAWVNAQTLPGSAMETWIYDVQDGADVDVRVRARNAMGVYSEWAQEDGHTVVGKTEPPSNVASLTVQQNGALCTFRWTEVVDKDLGGYEIRYTPQGSWNWENAQGVISANRGDLLDTASLPPGSWTVGIKALDTSKNPSQAAAVANITVTNFNDIVLTSSEHPRWPGAMDGFVVHPVTRELVPLALGTASDDGWETFDSFNPNPVAYALYQGQAVDMGFDAPDLRVWSQTVGRLGPGETRGAADPEFQLDHRLDAGAWSGMSPWTLGSVEARHLRPGVGLDPATGQGVVQALTMVVDVSERAESANGVVVPVGGLAVEFSRPFHTDRINVQLSAAGSVPLLPMYNDVTATGFMARVFDATGTDVGGSINWTAMGV